MMVTLELTLVEVRTISRLAGNLMASAFEAGIDPGVLESIYYKTLECLENEEIFPKSI